MAPHHSTHTPSCGAIHLTSLHLFFSLDSVVEQGKANNDSLSPWRILELLGMNTIQFSSMSKFLSYLYDHAIELEYSCVHILFIVYELVLSSYAMFLMCSSLFFIVHRISMNRQRIKIGVTVHWAVMATLSQACQSEGLGSREARRCFQLYGRGARVCGDQWMHVYLSGRGVRGRVVTALSSLVFPPRSGILVGVL